ncbi:hypothetical protein C1645_753509, partial [Glomus cerebriforme]
KKNKHAKQATETSTIDTNDIRRTRHSIRIQERAVTASTNATVAISRKIHQKEPDQKTTFTISDRPKRNVTAAQSTSVSNTFSIPSIHHKRKREEAKVFTSRVNLVNQSANNQSKKFKITTPSQPSIATVQESLVASLVVVQNTTIPQVTNVNKNYSKWSHFRRPYQS